MRELFECAWEQPAHARDEFVRQQAGADQILAEQVLELVALAREDDTPDRLEEAKRWDVWHRANLAEEPPQEKVRATATENLLAQLRAAPRLDPSRYEVGGEIGRGGMGVVKSIRDRLLNRQLALKSLLEQSDLDDEYQRKLSHQVLGRFLEEAQVTSQLDHPGVVPVHEFGLDELGRVYFTMRLVKGKTAGEVFRHAHRGEDGWTVTRALEVILKVCDTMAYAHAKGVLHRDLKPSNVMIGCFGEVYVMDWGLAKIIGQGDRQDVQNGSDQSDAIAAVVSARRCDAENNKGSPFVSNPGQRLGTPSYMAPEQARGEPVDQRTDVYAIGTLLYELLSGHAPYTTADLTSPAKCILDTVVEGPPKSIEQVRKGVPAELVAIVAMAMAREPTARYANTLELAAEVRAYLDRRVVRAYRTGALVEMRMWMRRNRALAATAMMALLVLVAAIVVVSITAADLNRTTKSLVVSNTRLGEQKALAAEKAALAERSATSAADSAEESARLADIAHVKESEARRSAEVAEVERQRATRAAEQAERAQRDALAAQAQAEEALELANAEREAKESARQEAEHQSARNQRIARLARYSAAILAAESALARGDSASAVEALDSCDEDLRGFEWGHLQMRADRSWRRLDLGAPVSSVIHVGGLLVAALTDSFGTLAFVQADTLEEIRRVKGHSGGAFALAGSPDGTTIASGGADGEVRLWDLEGRCLATLPQFGARVTCVAFSPDGQRIAFGGFRNSVTVVSHGGQMLRNATFPGGDISALHCDSDGLIIGTTAGKIYRCDANFDNVLPVEAHEDAVMFVAGHSKGSRSLSLSGGLDGTIRLWDEDITFARYLEAGPAGVVHGVLSKDSARIVSGHTDGTVRVWTVADHQFEELSGHSDVVTSVCFVARAPGTCALDSDASMIVSASVDATLRTWLLPSASASNLLEGAPPTELESLVFTGTCVRAFGNRHVRVLEWDDAGAHWRKVVYGAPAWWRVGFPASSQAVERVAGDFTPNGTRAVVASIDGRHCVRLTSTGFEFWSPEQSSCDWRVDESIVAACGAVTRNGRVLIGTESGEVLAYSADGIGAQPHPLWSTNGAIDALGGSANGDVVAAIVDQRSIALWRPTGTVLARVRNPDRLVALAVSDDGRRIATGEEDGTVRVFDTESGDELLAIRSYSAAARALAWTIDGCRLAVLHEDGGVAIHDSRSSDIAAMWRTSVARRSPSTSLPVRRLR